MTAKLITPPAVVAVSLAKAKSNLGYEVSETELDTLLTAWLMGIADYAEHQMGRAIMNQTWRVSLDCFPAAIRLPRPPVASVSFVKYYDATGVQQTLDPAAYALDSESEPCRLLPAPDTAWPATARRANAVTVEVVCGYGATDAATPAGIQLFLLAKLKEQFDPEVKPEKGTVQSSFIDHLLDRYTIPAF